MSLSDKRKTMTVNKGKLGINGIENVKVNKTYFYYEENVKDFIKALKENQEKLELALSKFANLYRKRTMPLVDGKLYLFGKTVEDYLEINKLAGAKLI